eukprot:3639957-Prymnesium_polylepis.1
MKKDADDANDDTDGDNDDDDGDDDKQLVSVQQQAALGASKPTFYIDLSAPGTPIPNPSPSWTEITDAN